MIGEIAPMKTQCEGRRSEKNPNETETLLNGWARERDECTLYRHTHNSHLRHSLWGGEAGRKDKRNSNKKNVTRPTATVDVFTPSNVIYCFKIATMSESAPRCCWWLSTHVPEYIWSRTTTTKTEFPCFFPVCSKHETMSSTRMRTLK